jgi:hypothetical protein
VEDLDRRSKKEIIDFGNPAKILFNTEEDLLVCLGI